MNKPSFSSIREMFEYLLPNFQIDKKVFTQILIMEEKHVAKNESHLRFYGGHLLGVDRVIFSDEDRARLYNDVLPNLDETVVENLIDNSIYVGHPHIKDGTPIFNPNFEVISNPFNMTIVYLIHLAENSKHLNTEEKHVCKVRLYAYMFYRFMASSYYKRFQFLADPAIAEAAYQSLNNKYILKVVGTWKNLIYYLAEDTIKHEGTHHETIVNFDDPGRIGRLISDPQTRLREYINNIYSEYKKAYDNKIKVSSSSTMIEIEDDVQVKEIIKHHGVYADYIKQQISDPIAFYKAELVNVVMDVMPSITQSYLVQTIQWTSENYFGLHRKEIIEAVEIVMEHAIKTVTAAPELQKDIANLIITLAGMYTSSRSKDQELLRARSIVEKLAKYATKSTNPTAIASTRTGWMLYLVLRAFSMRHYS